MKIVELDTAVAVADQVLIEDLASVAAAGYQVLVNNRPDGEVPGQPSSAAIADAAAAHGLTYHYVPVTAESFPGPDLEKLRLLFADAQHPVLAYCRSGTRSANLWVASQPAELQAQARQRAHSLGYDVAMSTRATS